MLSGIQRLAADGSGESRKMNRATPMEMFAGKGVSWNEMDERLKFSVICAQNSGNVGRYSTYRQCLQLPTKVSLGPSGDTPSSAAISGPRWNDSARSMPRPRCGIESLRSQLHDGMLKLLKRHTFPRDTVSHPR